jgi:hypothetical protein
MFMGALADDPYCQERRSIEIPALSWLPNGGNLAQPENLV